MIAEVFRKNNTIDWICGIPSFLTEDGFLKKNYNHASAKYKYGISNGWYKEGGFGFLQQESMFWRRGLWEKVGGLSLDFKLAADYELWIKFSKYAELWTINLPLSSFRLRESSRSIVLKERYIKEVDEICSNLEKLPILYRLFGKFTELNFLLRLLTWKKTFMIFQRFNSNEWVYTSKFRSVSGLTISELFLEK